MSARAHPTEAPAVERVSYRVSEFSRASGIPKSSVHDLIRQGKLRAVRLGRIVLIPISEIDRILS